MTEEDSEKRFHSVMDKLFSSPKPKSISRNHSSRGVKRGSSLLSGGSNGELNDSGRNLGSMSGLNRALVPVRSVSSALSSTKTPLCRPWDRADLMKRLATFKSMTWFGKPKVVSAVNCARRGWINVEMDIIACEACGARLLFSNPSSWTQQQIEKAAAVFSLKLDNGHKLLCPWIDNSCDESLAQFPPTPAPALIDGYRERSSALLQLSALPIISSSAIDRMRCPQLECFLEQSSIDYGAGFVNVSRTEGPEHEHADSANMYYQALKLISLCGWEPRALPYAVDCKDRSSQVLQNGHSEETSPDIVNVRNPGVVMYSKSGFDGAKDVDEDPSLNTLPSDPASVVLDCKLCGATAGLWAFSTVPRPLEWFRIVESLEVNGQIESANCNANVGCIAGAPKLDESVRDNLVGRNGGTIGTTLTKERCLSLNMSIAGGPPPAKQSYRATVSLPIISRHLRADLSSKSDAINRMSSVVSMDHETVQCNSSITNSQQQDNDHTTPCKVLVQSEDKRRLTQNGNEDGLGVSRDNDHLCPNGEGSRNDKNDDTSSEGCFVIEPEIRTGHALDTCSHSRMGTPVEGSQKMPQSSGKNDDKLFGTRYVENGSQSEEGDAIMPDSNGSIIIQKLNGNSAAAISIPPLDEVSSEARQVAISVSSSPEANMIVDNACTMNSQKDDIGFYHPNSYSEGTSDKIERATDTMQLTVCKEHGATLAQGFVNNLNWAQLDQAMEFDPIRQHRHFCPWIVSTGKTGPGWRLTLSALDREKASSRPSITESPSSSMFEADDPITSVRNLFKSPSTKRHKTSR